jgi:hypothetical protein
MKRSSKNWDEGDLHGMAGIYDPVFYTPLEALLLELPSIESETLGNCDPKPYRPKTLPLHIGLAEPKQRKGKYYWYWRYYDRNGKYVCKYLSTRLSEAVVKAKAIGIPEDASDRYRVNKTGD